MQKVEDLETLIVEGSITREESIKRIIELIYRNKAWFGFSNLSPGDFHDFLIYYYEKINFLLENFDPHKGKLGTFLYANVRQIFIFWQKRKRRTSLVQEALFPNAKEIAYEELLNKYANDAEETLVTECDYKNFIQGEKSLAKKINAIYKSNHCPEKTVSEDCNEDKKLILKKEFCLILTIKTSYYVTDELLEKVSIFTDVPLDTLKKMVEQGRMELETRIRGREICLQRRDKAWYLRRKYLKNRAYAERNSLFSETINRKLRKKTIIWKRYNEELKKEKFRVILSNIKVAKILGMNARRVYYVLKAGKKIIDIPSLEEYHSTHEYLFSKWKPKQKERDATDIPRP